ncbi:hypothetical protein [Roseibium aggregatum]|uniref:Uncharacterized protein n=1 Tax=Roseibium aggregatum TaxID=187304 RepID=A0A939EHN5_9HYPH|nr:hypothetical protein [Roseibium aggregatum]MBN9673204.1 hypothetical protein [Roseibium aggregatum]
MMLRSADRMEIFESYPVLAAHLRNWQDQTYDPANLEYREGDSVIFDLETDEAVSISAEQAAELNAENEAELAELKDDFSNIRLPALEKPELLVATTDAMSMDDFSNGIGPAFLAFAREMGWTEFAFVSDCRRPILSQDNDYPPVEAAEKTLLRAGLSKSGDDGYLADAEAFAALLGPLFYIARCNACAPYILFSAKGASAVGTLCKYANIHLDCYDEDETNRIDAGLEAAGMELLPDGHCHEKFSDDGAISGRRIEL